MQVRGAIIVIFPLKAIPEEGAPKPSAKAADGRRLRAARASWGLSDGPQLESVRKAAPQVSVRWARAGRLLKNGSLALCRKLISESGVVGLKVSAAELEQSVSCFSASGRLETATRLLKTRLHRNLLSLGIKINHQQL